MTPRAPDSRIPLRTAHPLAVVGAARLALRRAGHDRHEIDDFTREALTSPDPRGSCDRYVRLETE